MIRRWLLIVVIVALVGGTILSRPVFWSRPVVGEKTSQIARHWLDCVFTATSALTGTGLSPHDIGDDFNPRGQLVILGLMQAGGLAVLVAGSVVGWRFRRRIGWGRQAETPVSVPWQLPVFVCGFALIAEALGAVIIHQGQHLPEQSAIRPWFNAVFLSVSAFCNAGLTLTRDSVMGERAQWMPYAVLLPLMLLGSLGGPALYDLVARLSGRRLGRDTQITFLASVGLLILGAGMLFFVESTPRWQLRNPREDALGKLGTGALPGPGEMITFSNENSPSVKSQRMNTMGPGLRGAAALFLSQSARGGGLRVARLDETSLAPASRAWMMVLMLMGGGLGGTAGGLSLIVVAVLLSSLFRRRPAEDGAQHQAIVAAAGVATGMFVLLMVTMLVLIYRDTGSVDECAFEAVSACCNCGLTAGLTRRLAIESQVMIIVAMLCGRVIPLAVLARQTRAATSPPMPTLRESAGN